MAELELWEHDQTLYLFTSLTAGSSHIVTATSRIETILRANRIPFSYIDTATNETARKLFQRRARGKKLPLLVKEGFVLADLDQVEEWNEFGELKENIGDVKTTTRSIVAAPATMSAPTIPVPSSTPKSANNTPASDKENTKPSSAAPQQNLVMRSLAEEAAAAVKAKLSAATPAPKQPTPAAHADTEALEGLVKTQTKPDEPVDTESRTVKDPPEASVTSSDDASETPEAATQVTTKATPKPAKDEGKSEVEATTEHDKPPKAEGSGILPLHASDVVSATKVPISESSGPSQSIDPASTPQSDDVKTIRDVKPLAKDTGTPEGASVVESAVVDDREQEKEQQIEGEKDGEQDLNKRGSTETKEERTEKAASPAA